jgi:ribosome biogenesis protein NSA1
VVNICRLDEKHCLSLKKNGLFQVWVDDQKDLVENSSFQFELNDFHGFQNCPNKENLKLNIGFTKSGDVKLWKIDDHQNEEDLVVNELFSFSLKSPLECCSTCYGGVAFGGKENDLQIYDNNTGNLVWKAKNVPNDKLNLRVPIWITVIHFLRPEIDDIHTSCHIATGTGYKQVRIYDTKASNHPIHSYNVGEQFRVTSLQSIEEGNYLYIGDTSGGLVLWDMRMGRRLYTLKGGLGCIKNIQLSPSGDFLATVGLDRMLYLYKTKTNKLYEKMYMKSRLNCSLFLSETTNRRTLNQNHLHDVTSDDEEEEDDEDDEDEVVDFNDGEEDDDETDYRGDNGSEKARTSNHLESKFDCVTQVGNKRSPRSLDFSITSRRKHYK